MSETDDWQPPIGVLSQILVGLSIVAYMLALTLPVYPHHNPPVQGVHCLPYFNVPQWYSNPLYFFALALILSRHSRWSWIPASLSLGLGMTFPLMKFQEEIGLGYPAWMASFTFLLVVSIAHRLAPTAMDR